MDTEVCGQKLLATHDVITLLPLRQPPYRGLESRFARLEKANHSYFPCSGNSRKHMQNYAFTEHAPLKDDDFQYPRPYGAHCAVQHIDWTWEPIRTVALSFLVVRYAYRHCY